MVHHIARGLERVACVIVAWFGVNYCPSEGSQWKFRVKARPAVHMSSKNNPEELKRDLLVSKAWLQAVAIVILFGFFILGFLAYRTYTGEAPIPARVVDPDRRSAVHA